MKCAFIMKDFSIKYEELEKDAVLELSSSDKYFSINMNDESMIFIDNSIYTLDNMEDIIPVLIVANMNLIKNS